ncbi:uncharacterized protein KIAA1143 homolog [Wyeomyia smithii]|uniref:uncharacterized protein KIAA1143 homolog n=1 Tax=Wyeomyia smithii TaxID=174621 RepID=UPI002467C75F|nr:uncharacterized protein KIAA1143 homolog [Wyeomyia smithii]
MSKRNVAFIKPEEPDFLKRLKAQIGYKEGPTVETKRQQVQNLDDSDEEYDEREDEKPQVVVLKAGDLTAEEAASAEKEESEKPADLSKKIVFKSRKAKKDDLTETPLRERQKKSHKDTKSKLSFMGDDDEDDDG